MEKRKANNWILFISILFVITLLAGISGYIINYNSKNIKYFLLEKWIL